MKLSEALPPRESNYIASSDLDGHPGKSLEVVINGFDVVSVKERDGSERAKAIVYFQGFQKPLLLNKSNKEFLSDSFGDETDDWNGNKVVLFVKKVDFQGKMVDGLRMRMPRMQPQRLQQPSPAAHAQRPMQVQRQQAPQHPPQGRQMANHSAAHDQGGIDDEIQF